MLTNNLQAHINRIGVELVDKVISSPTSNDNIIYTMQTELKRNDETTKML